MDILSIVLGMVFILVISPTIENLMGIVYSLFEIAQLKLSIVKMKLQNKLGEANSDLGVKHIRGFVDEEEDYD